MSLRSTARCLHPHFFGKSQHYTRKQGKGISINWSLLLSTSLLSSLPLQRPSIWRIPRTRDSLRPLKILWASDNKDNFQQRLPPGTQFALGGGWWRSDFTLAGSKGTLRRTLISRPASFSVDHRGEKDVPGELVSAYRHKKPFAWPPNRTKTPCIYSLVTSLGLPNCANHIVP